MPATAPANVPRRTDESARAVPKPAGVIYAADVKVKPRLPRCALSNNIASAPSHLKREMCVTDTRPPVAVFDLDGTLIDTAPDLAAALNAGLADEGLAPVTLDEARHAVGHGARVMIERALTYHGVAVETERVERMHARFLEFYGANIAVGSLPFPGVEAAMDALAARGIILAVCTNKYEGLAVQLLRTLGMTERFAAIAGGDTYGVSKPDPRHLTQTIAAAGGGHAVMIGDSEADTGAAIAAGIPSIAVTFGYANQPIAELGAHVVIDHFDALEAHVVALLAAQSGKA